jgi:hypothetical protein
VWKDSKTNGRKRTRAKRKQIKTSLSAMGGKFSEQNDRREQGISQIRIAQKGDLTWNIRNRYLREKSSFSRNLSLV